MDPNSPDSQRTVCSDCLQKLLTHKSPQMTQRYVHLRDEALRKASKVADKMLNAIPKQDEIVVRKTKKSG